MPFVTNPKAGFSGLGLPNILWNLLYLCDRLIPSVILTKVIAQLFSKPYVPLRAEAQQRAFTCFFI